MLFSIVVPAYNCISFLSGCVDSVLSQHFDDYEVILVDDGSTDGTSELCDELAKDDRVTVIRNANGGPSRARNAGMSLASGDYIVFLDADDEFGDGYLVGLARELEENPCDVLLGSLRTDFGVGSGGKDVRLFDVAYANGLNLRGLIRYFFTTADDAPFAAWHNVYSRELIEGRHLRFDEEFVWSEDRDFVLRVLAQKPSWHCIDVPGYRHRISVSNSVTGKASADKVLRAMAFDEKWLRIASTNELFSITRMFLSTDYISLTVRGFNLPDDLSGEQLGEIVAHIKAHRECFEHASFGASFYFAVSHGGHGRLTALLGKLACHMTTRKRRRLGR